MFHNRPTHLSLSLSLSFPLAFEEEPIITSYRFSVEIFADSPLPSWRIPRNFSPAEYLSSRKEIPGENKNYGEEEEFGGGENLAQANLRFDRL